MKKAIHSRTVSGVLALTLLPVVIVGGQDMAASVGFDPIAYIHGEIEAGSKTISVPCDRYWLTPAEDSTCYLALKGLSDVTIDFNGGELIGKVKTSMLDLEDCTNVTLRNAFNSRCSFVGPTLEGCTFQYHCDDCVNISGYYAIVTEQRGRTLRLAPHGGRLWITPGDTCQLMTFDGVCLPDAKVLSVSPAGETTAAEREVFNGYNLWPGFASGATRAYDVELDADRDLPPGSVVCERLRCQAVNPRP